MRHTHLLRSTIDGTRRWGALGLFRASRCMLRGALRFHRRHLISHGGLRVALSGANLLQRSAATLLFGLKHARDRATGRD
jgi:hypothetical protein